MLLFVGILIAFVFGYDQHNPIENLVNAVLKQSTDQTAVNHGIGNSLLHVLTYPSEVFRDLLPAMLFLPLLFVNGNARRLERSNPFAVRQRFCFLRIFLCIGSHLEHAHAVCICFTRCVLSYALGFF